MGHEVAWVGCQLFVSGPSRVGECHAAVQILCRAPRDRRRVAFLSRLKALLPVVQGCLSR